MLRPVKYIARLIGLGVFGFFLGSMLGGFIGVLLAGATGGFMGSALGSLLGIVWAFKTAHTMRHLE